MGAEQEKAQNAENPQENKENKDNKETKENKESNAKSSKTKKEKTGEESEEEEDEEYGEESDEEDEKEDKEKTSKKETENKNEKKLNLESVTKKSKESSESNKDKSNKQKITDSWGKIEEEKEDEKINEEQSSELSNTLPREVEDKYTTKKEDKEKKNKNRDEINKKYKDVLPGEIPEERKISKASKLAFGYTCSQTIESAHEKAITCLTYILKRNEIATGSVDETIKIWKINYKKGEISLNKELTGHSDSITCLKDFPKLNCFCSTSSDNTIKLWDCSSLKCLKTLKYHTKCVLSCCYNPIGKKEIFSGGEDLNIIVWSTEKGIEKYEEIKALKGHTKRVSSLAYADDFNYLLSGSDDKTLRVWDTKNIEDIQCIKIIKDMMSPVDFLLYLENRLIVGCEDGLISFIKMNKMKRCRSVKFSNSPIYSINIFHKHRYLLIGNKDGKARVWKIGTNKREVLKGHTKAVTGICDFEDDYIVTTSIDQSIKLWKKG